MSLTSYLSDKEHQVLRDKFKTEFTKPKFEFYNNLIAPPLTLNYGIIGTAFDYLLRFYIQFQNKGKFIDTNSWVAESGFSGLKIALSNDAKKVSAISKRFEDIKKYHSIFIKKGKITDELIAGSLFLAKLDLFVRSRMIAPDLLFEEKLDIQDLKNLYSGLDEKLFSANDRCILNPIFGEGSLLVGGADADLILDDTLIDIKVTKNLKLERDYLNQIIGYYILSLIGDINFQYERKTIKYVAIYFARHSFLWKIPILELGDYTKIENFKNWFIDYFEEYKIERQKTLKIKISNRRIQRES